MKTLTAPTVTTTAPMAAASRVRGSRRPVLTMSVALLATVLAISACSTPPPARAAPAPPAWGVLASTCAPDRLAAPVPGVTVVVVEARWDRLVTELATALTRCLDAGARVVLGSGVQYPPGGCGR